MKTANGEKPAVAPSGLSGGLGETMEISDETLILARYAVDNLLRQYDLTDEGKPKTAMALLKARYELDLWGAMREVKRLEATGDVINDLTE